MTKLPTRGGSYTRDDKGKLMPAEKAAPAPKPAKKGADK